MGALDDAGGRLVAGALAGYALGLAGYAGLHLLTRASYAAADMRTPAIVNVAVAVVGSVLMAVLTAVVSESGRMVAIGVAHSVAMVAGAVALGVAVRRRVGVAWPVGATLARSAAGAVAAGVAARLVADLVPVDGRLGRGAGRRPRRRRRRGRLPPVRVGAAGTGAEPPPGGGGRVSDASQPEVAPGSSPWCRPRTPPAPSPRR